MLTTIKDDQTAVESVLKGDVDQYILDGTDKVLAVPQCLQERIEKLPHQVKIMQRTLVVMSLGLCLCIDY